MRDVIVFDIECTCWDDTAGKSRDERETIEIGAVKLDGINWNVVSTFDIFIKPVNNPILSPYCTNLTTIKQEDVDKATTFGEAIHEFDVWSFTSGYNVPLYLSWGYFDKNHLIMEAGKKGYTGRLITNIGSMYNHVNVKERFAQRMGGKPCGVSKALGRLEMQFEGTQHRGVDDAVNIAKIAKFLQSIIGV